MTIWAVRAEQLLEQALDESRSSIDAIPTVSAALAALRIECGELPSAAMDGYPFQDADGVDDLCTCPPDLAARGGFRSTCPAAHHLDARLAEQAGER
ncbi:hypothetical protein ACIBEJ_34650 [Nonomuraea sp. NPDC050790]|uniref:hypothetical protein n=1 Tax=Nonomuraea sp. NPDC050790 TaxID=3364371 RepID=UPI003792A45D